MIPEDPGLRTGNPSRSGNKNKIYQVLGASGINNNGHWALNHSLNHLNSLGSIQPV